MTDPQQLTDHQRAGAVIGRFAAPGHVTVELTWWEEDGTERRGWANVAPDASPETLHALTQMLRAATTQMETETEERPWP